MFRTLAPLALLVGCVPEVPDDLADRLTVQGGCADLFVYAADDADSLVVSISIQGDLVADAQDAGKVTTTVITLPDPDAEVMLTDGTRVTDAMCDDVVENYVPPRAEWSATAGTLTIEVTPGAKDIHEARAAVTAEGVVFDDAPPVDLQWDDISVGWFAG